MNKDRREPEYPTELESQFILRLPEEPAKTLREVLKCGENLKNRLTIQVDSDMRNGEVRFDHWLMHGKIVDLPTIVESLKTIDNKSFYKTADISQMMICKDEPDQQPNEEESPAKNKKKDPYKVDKKFLWPHGITPPTKNVRKRRFRKTLKKKYVEAPEIEKEVKRLLRADNEAISVSWEVVKDEDDQASQSVQTLIEPAPPAPPKPEKKHKERSSKKETSKTANTSTAVTSTTITSSAYTSTASTSKASTSKASTSKASTTKASSSKASTSKASTSKASTSKASTSSASTSKASTSSANTSTAHASKAKEPSNVVDIFGGAVSDSEGEDDHVNVDVVEGQISSSDGHISESNSLVSLRGRQDSYSTSFDSQIFHAPKTHGRSSKKASRSKAPTPSTSGKLKSGALSSEDDDYQSRDINKDNDNMTLRIEQVKTELEELKQRRQRTQHEIAGMENLALRQRFQDILHTLNQDIMYKEMEYQGMITLQNSEDI